MNKLKKILVAVNLADKERFVADGLPPTTKEAIERAEWLARANSAELLLLYVLPSGTEQLSHDRQILMAQGDNYKSVKQFASDVLAEIAEASTKRGFRTKSKVVIGKCWVEIIREVIRNNHDLVIGGTRKQGPIRRMLFGSTGLKLLRKCPCPVWINKPEENGDERVESVLVAHDLTDVGDAALELGCLMARIRNTELHVLHSIEYEPPASARVEQLRQDEIEARIRKQLDEFGANEGQIHVEIGDADGAILNYAERHEIELVVMGTIARAGVFGVTMGNTAEKLLPFLQCSVLAVKPTDFKSPVLLELDEYKHHLA